MNKETELKNKTKSLIHLLEKITGKKVVLGNITEPKKIDEVKRTKMRSAYQVEAYVKELLRKYGLYSKHARVTLKGNIILVEDSTPEPDTFNYRNVSFELQENGFKKGRNTKINDKAYSKVIDEYTRVIVLLPLYE